MRAMEASLNEVAPKSGLPWYWQVAAACAAILIIFSRQPEALLHAQFFAEDGRVWFADAYNSGWLPSLFRSQDGYFQTLPRLAAALALLVPLKLAPLTMNVCGTLVQILPVFLLISGRLASWGSLAMRASMAFTYLALPNSMELNVSIEEAQWHLALLACLLLLSSPPPSRGWKTFDFAVFLLCGLTGPFAILLLPIAVLRLVQCRDPFSRLTLVVLSMTAAFQAYALLSTHRDNWPLGASFRGLIRIVTGQVFLGTLVGSNYLGLRESLPFLVGVTLACLFVLGYCFVNATREWKLFLIFCYAVLAAALRRPFTPNLPAGLTSWGMLVAAPGIRYWFLPMVAFAWTIVWYLFNDRKPVRRVIGVTLLTVMLMGWVRDWRIPPQEDLHFADYARAFMASAPGTEATIPIPPKGWSMRLVKR